MIIKNIEIKNFRNISEASLVPCDGMNVICGENAQGKTNTLEAIWLFSGAKSFRGAKEKELLNLGCQKSVLNLSFIGEGIEKSAKIEIAEKRTAFLNDNKLKAPSLLAGNLNAIVFSPIDLRIVTDGPGARRKFLDLAIGQLYPAYIDILRDYTRAVQQRNSIIKDMKFNSSVSSLLDAFENEIAQKGEKIVLYRNKYIEKINYFLNDIYSGISNGKETLQTEYISSIGFNFKEILYIRRSQDMLSGVTSVGPHRDDISFKINGLDAKNYGSQGQKRSIALSLKLSEAEVIKNNVGECPICLMDDVMSELDPYRQNYVLNHIKGMQTFLTCCDPENYKNMVAGRVFTVKNGSVE